MEDEIKVGEYIRTLKGNICKVLHIRKKSRFTSTTGHACVSPERYFVDNTKQYSISKPYVKKHSFNLIDLIEANDYVNGEQVSNVDKIDNENVIEWENGDMYKTTIQNDKFIKSIVTHEQFKSIEYTIHEREERENG